MPGSLRKERLATLAQLGEHGYRSAVESRPEHLCIAREQRIDIGEGAHESEERLAHRLVLTLHLLIGLVGQPDLCFGGPVQLESPFGSNQLPITRNHSKTAANRLPEI